MHMVVLFEETRRATPLSKGFRNVALRLSVEWVRQALQRHGKSTIRRRVVTNEVVVWLVVGRALFRILSIRGVLRHLRLAPHGQDGGWLDQRSVRSDTLAKARQRVGAAPLQELFHICARLGRRSGVPVALPRLAGVHRRWDHLAHPGYGGQ